MPKITDEQYEQLMQTINDLKQEVERVKNSQETHQHLGNDSSKEFLGQTDFIGRSLVLGSGVAQGDKVFVPFQIIDAQVDGVLASDKSSRATAKGVLVTRKYQADEQIHTLVSSIKNLPVEEINIPLNKIDWSHFSEGRLRVINTPQGPAAFSGPSVLGPLLFIVGERTPSIQGRGTISLGGSLFTDSTAQFGENSLVGALVNISDSDGNHLAGYKVISNTDNVITLGQYKSNGAVEYASFPYSTGQYQYYVVVPGLLGAAQNPFDRGYFGQDIRFGYGPSSGEDVFYMKWGNGSPEGVVTANPPSMYLRMDGSNGNTLYIKESGTGATGWRKVTTSAP